MGKRELFLIVGFVVTGALVYQFTAPPPRPGQEGLWTAISRGWREIRADMTDSRASATATTTAATQISPAVTRLRIAELRGRLTITGEDRQDVVVELQNGAYGSTKAEALATAQKIVAELRETAGLVTATVLVPRGTRRSTTHMLVRLPRRLAVQLDVVGGPLDIRNIDELRFTAIRSDTVIRDVARDVRGDQRNGDVQIVRAGSLKLTGRRVDARVEGISGSAEVEIIDGELQLRDVGGDLRVEGRRVDIDGAAVKGVTRINNANGRIRLDGISNNVDVDATRSSVTLRLERSAPLDVSTSEEPIELTLAEREGLTIDAVAQQGTIRTDIAALEVAREEREQQARGPVAGGGPTATLRTIRGDIIIRPATAVR